MGIFILVMMSVILLALDVRTLGLGLGLLAYTPCPVTLLPLRLYLCTFAILRMLPVYRYTTLHSVPLFTLYLCTFIPPYLNISNPLYL